MDPVGAGSGRVLRDPERVTSRDATMWHHGVIEAVSHVTTSSALLAAAVVLLAAWALSYRRRSGMPPGPPSVPFLGSLPFINFKTLHEEMFRLAREYGDIMSFYIGRTPLVVLSSYDVIKEAFVFKGVEFAGRLADDPRMKAANPYDVEGIIHGSYSPEWKKQRNVSLSILRSLGWGKNILEHHIREECRQLIKNFKRYEGTAFSPGDDIGISISNVICSLLFGHRFSHDDKEFQNMVKLIDKFFAGKYSNPQGTHIPLLRLMKSYRQGKQWLTEYSEGMYEFTQKKLLEARERLAAGKEADNFVSLYLLEMERVESGEGRLSEDWLGPIIRDFFSAGTETSTTTLTWALMFLARHPEVQLAVQEEMDRVVGRAEHSFSLADKERLVYTEAALLEVQRLSSIAPFSIPHTTMCDVQLRGYRIPRGSIVLANIYAVHTNEKLWGSDVMEFRPERYIGPDGKCSKPEYWIPYSMGRRLCLGEQLAKQELFLFFAHLTHAFQIQFDRTSPPPSQEADYMGVRKAKPYKICLTPRF